MFRDNYLNSLKDETKNDIYKLKNLLEKGKGDILSAFAYYPFSDHNIMTVESTESEILILLQNGNMITIPIKENSKNLIFS